MHEEDFLDFKLEQHLFNLFFMFNEVPLKNCMEESTLKITSLKPETPYSLNRERLLFIHSL